MIRKILAVMAAISIAVSVFPSEAQEPKRVPRIGFLTGSLSVFPGRTEAFLQGLRELGYVEGMNIVIDWRYTEGKPDRYPALAAEGLRKN